ncbi:MAG: PIG-L family deacetylase [Clostridia bacterium]|nr:PIG-L family deacetylase [Clostridia bacterium]
MNYLFVVAHPDDEVLGAGGTMFKLSERGDNVSVCIMSGTVNARALRPGDEELKSDINDSMSILGINDYIEGEFPNIKFNTVPHLELVQFIEKAIIKSEADIVITHHPGDTNNDHYHTSLACQAAIRLFQRRNDVSPLKEFMFMEVLSATDWSVNEGFNKFNPNSYFEIGKDGLERKIQALSAYRDVMRDYPHPRSNESLEGLAAVRGSQANLNYAEAFQSVFRRNF